MAWEVCFDDSRRVRNAYWSTRLSTHKQLRLGLQRSDPRLGPFNRFVCQEERSHTFLGFVNVLTCYLWSYQYERMYLMSI